MILIFSCIHVLAVSFWSWRLNPHSRRRDVFGGEDGEVRCKVFSSGLGSNGGGGDLVITIDSLKAFAVKFGCISWVSVWSEDSMMWAFQRRLRLISGEVAGCLRR